MGYRDDLYRPVHIIGYTGELNEEPTVYFYNPEDGSYGHITQNHSISANEGREGVRSDHSYEMVNENHKGAVRLLERRKGRVFHPSRNPFIPICGSKFFPDAETDFRAIALLAPAIVRFFEKKLWSSMDRNQRTAYRAMTSDQRRAFEKDFPEG